ARPVWRRDWQAVLRWPATRVLRVTLLGAAAGLAAAGAWRDTPALLIAAAAALLVCALDSVEGLAQEADHLIRRETLPVPPGRLTLRHLAAPAVVMVGVILVAAGGAMALGGAGTVVEVGAVVAVPAALAAVCGAALSIETGPVNSLQVEMFAGPKIFFRTVAPLVLAVAGVLPVLAARAAVDAGGSAAAGAVPADFAVLMLVVAAGAWLGREA
ncbi:MAG: hypothetical protein M3066_12450, partial [Actinomycetota bacterium]|nr:hypothetical protein [Actinomycetota bacterium]